MLTVVLCVSLVGMICGLIFLHWFGMAALSLGVTVGVLALADWDWKLLAKWFGLLTALQGAT